MKKYYIELGAIFVALLMMSTVTAVQQTNSESEINILNKIEQNRINLKRELKINLIENSKIGGILDILVQLITLIIQLVLNAIDVVQNIIGLVNMIQNLINAFTTLFQLIQDLLDLINNIFNPEESLMI
jgi:hypothetical protein